MTHFVFEHVDCVMLPCIQYCNWLVTFSNLFRNLWGYFFLRENNYGTKQILFSGKIGGVYLSLVVLQNCERFCGYTLKFNVRLYKEVKQFSWPKIPLLAWLKLISYCEHLFFFGGERKIFAEFMKKTFTGRDIKINIYSCEEIYSNDVT